MEKKKKLGYFDQGQIVMAKSLGQSMSERDHSEMPFFTCD